MENQLDAAMESVLLITEQTFCALMDREQLKETQVNTQSSTEIYFQIED